MKKCDIVIPVWNELESTKKCITLLKDNTRYPYRLIVVDNGSVEPTKAYLESLKELFPGYLLIRNNTNLGFVKAVNQGMRAAENSYVCLLNNDAYVKDGWLTSLTETVESGPASIGIANPTSNVFGKDSTDGAASEFQELDSARGFCMLIKREVIRKIGLFDEIYGMGYFEEKDFSRRAIEAGYISIRSKASFVEHKDRLSFDKLSDREEVFKRNEDIYNKRWGRPLSVAFIAGKGNNLQNKTGLINGLLDKGHRVNIFSLEGKYPKGLRDHIGIRMIPAGGILSGYGILFKLWERRRKKRIEIVIADDGALKFFDKFRFIHKADVVSASEAAGRFKT
jgi:GT2 family glycosyltransferase